MQFRCVNCGGNVIYDPKSGHMICASCNSQDTEEIVKQNDSYICVSCGGKLTVNEYTSATRCEYCGTYNIIDEKVTYPYGPDLVLPFRFSKEQATELLRKEFKDKLFCPHDFLSERTLENLEGDYVPFWMYSYDTEAIWEGIGTKVRTWRSGNTEYTETSKYQVARELEIDFNRIPADASIAMPDKIMDLMEPYEYEDLKGFDAKYLSGYTAETYNQTPDGVEVRAKAKADRDAREWLNSTLTGYNSLSPTKSQIIHKPRAREFAVMPVWKYVYRYHSRNYEYYINGQTGKVYGTMPKSTGRILFTGGTMLAGLLLLMQVIQFFVEVF